MGYGVKNQRGVQFRIWATTVFKKYMGKGFVLDDERLKDNGGGRGTYERVVRPHT